MFSCEPNSMHVVSFTYKTLPFIKEATEKASLIKKRQKNEPLKSLLRLVSRSGHDFREFNIRELAA
jgi:hypothetical protein